ncbi:MULTISPECIES: peroxiredoxin [Reinekea]|jgi:peroxiredoxin (alkyl hydroperoxide reductase subunit C)|uniref:Thioredoxin peroxidase n=1 Tax=Reinekea forsetii TaxID=1336806 RepID=A0A2K8KRV0_9GAMM|nr:MULTISPECIES: peroxiredoxin [Reinekea]ATX76034.1 peroxidase [Reinekea forsetii]MDO7645163.1 peroxiredoxin [Reinekea forsetii]
MSVLLGRKAPEFIAPAVLGNGEIVGDFDFAATTKGKYALVFFYPLDFTFVCPSELIALDHRMAKLTELGVEVMAVSVDSHFTHNAWRNTPINDGGIGPVKYTMVGDMSHDICKAYGVESIGGDSYYPAGVAFRASFVIDKSGVVRAQHMNDEPIGRNIDELVRVVEALQFFEENGHVCPAGWQKGDEGMINTPTGVADYLAGNSDKL